MPALPTLDPRKFSAIAHRDHDHCNPMAAAKIERILDLVTLDGASLALDLGCGRAELALRIIERFGSTVLAVDHSPFMLDAARERAQWTGAVAKLQLDDTDIRAFRADPETFQLTVMLGAGGIDGGIAGICRTLSQWTKPNGYVLVGEGYWKRKPLADRLRRVEAALAELGAEKQALEEWLLLPDAYADDHREALKTRIARQGDLTWQLARLETEWLELSEALEGLGAG